MKMINLNDLNNAMVVSEQEAADVKGGPIYMQYDGVDGSVTMWQGFSGGVRVAVGDVNGDS